MRVLIGQGGDLGELYAVPRTPWLRVNFVSTVDGAATGEDGRSGSINNPPDQRVFEHLREQCDVVWIGAGTARIEGYRDIGKPLVVVSRSGEVPERLRDAPSGDVLMATYAASPGLEDARRKLGNDHVLVVGQNRVDLGALKAELASRGWGNQLSEGGPHLLRDLFDEGVADELDLTVVPRALGGHHIRITDGPPVDIPLTLHTLAEEDGTLLGRWFVDHA
ncbi:MAG: dihydrofolate reductase family protein [Nocardioides sp.]|nr:dihydrofolate reductase family protein [Nocardioides sp.]